ncbi:MAG: hypothetical protein R3C61_18795 [Bacteroidia bacterium]
MKKLLFLLPLLCLLAGSHRIIGQPYCTYSGGNCTSNLSPPTDYAQNQVNQICQILNLPLIRTYRSDTGNACATVYYNRPIISYNSGFLEYLKSYNLWAPVSVLAHEVGHHYNRDVLWYGNFKHPWTKELQADFVSGYVMYKLGASLSDAQSAQRVSFDWMGSTSHPDSPRRLDALTAGYHHAMWGN